MRRLLLAGLVVGVGGCSYVDREAAPYRPPGIQENVADEASGRHAYQRDCAWCHGDRGEGTSRGPSVTRGTNGPALTHYMLSTGRMPVDSPEKPLRHTEPVYSPRQIEALIEYVTSLGADGPPLPDVEPSRGDLGLGAELYADNCAACHSSTGIGGTLTPGRPSGDGPRFETGPATKVDVVAPSLHVSDAQEIADAIVTGPGTMPVFGPDVFDDRELDSVVRYVLYLGDPDDRGGSHLGRVGPVAEGAVAWVIGLGALLALTRLIGERSDRR